MKQFIRILEEERQNDNYIEFQDFEQEELFSLDCSQMEFKSVVFRHCRWDHCDFTKASFYDCLFEHCTFVSCGFYDSYLRNVTLTDCQLDSPNFAGSHLKETKIFSSVFRFAGFSNSVWDRPLLTDCNLSEAAITQSKLLRPVFKNVDFTHTDFFKTPLKNIDLSDCIIDGMVVSETFSELKGAKIEPSQALVIAQMVGVKIV